MIKDSRLDNIFKRIATGMCECGRPLVIERGYRELFINCEKCDFRFSMLFCDDKSARDKTEKLRKLWKEKRGV